MKQIKLFESINGRSEEKINNWLKENADANIIICEPIKATRGLVHDLFILYETKED